MKNQKSVYVGMVLLFVFLQSGCATKATAPEPSLPQPPPVLRSQPKIGLILGPGGWKAFSHIGVLRELEKSKIPIHAIAGLEMGALVAGFYAQNPSANFVDWTLGKIKAQDLKKSKLFTKDPVESQFEGIRPLIRESAKLPVQSSKIPFGCTSQNLELDKTVIAKSGSLEDVLEICIPSPPVFATKGNVTAGPADVVVAAQWLRSQGAELVIFVNPLAQGSLLRQGVPTVERLYWREIKRSLDLQLKDVDFVIGVHTRDYEITSFDARKSFILFGSQSGKIAAKKLIEKYGF